MKRQFFSKKTGKTIGVTAVIYVMAMAGILLIVNACRKNSSRVVPKTEVISQLPSNVLTVAAIRSSKDGKTSEVFFNEREQVYTIDNAANLALLQNAFNKGEPVKISSSPHETIVTQVNKPTEDELLSYHSFKANGFQSTRKIYSFKDAAAEAVSIDRTADVEGLTSSGASGLTTMIPDMATANLIFNYLASQCCAIPGTHEVTPCISFQYVEDGCYARAHKMCWVINNKYHYNTQKVFSFANNGVNTLSVKADKWGGCCINWWYHVAPLLTIKTASGPKAYVFDPAMFDGPVTLSTWLGGQANTSCTSGAAGPNMYSVQPTSAYSPANYAGTLFDTDPDYSSTNSTLIAYSTLVSCP